MLGTDQTAQRILLNPDELAACIGAPDLVVVDCRFDLLRPAAGREAYAAGHIPGAFYADLDRDLAAPRRTGSGRHPLPDPAVFARLLGSWGVTPESTVVAYDAAGGAIAARLWWLLRWVGHGKAAVLNGGYPAWLAAGLPVSQDEPAILAGRYPVEPGSMPVLSVTEVEAGLAAGQLLLLDARDAQRYAGHVEPIDTRAGHIPGAVNRPFTANLDTAGRFLDAADIAASLAELVEGEQRQLVAMCGSGVTACHNLLALELAGVRGADGRPVPLYVGSWSEWIVDASRPVAGSNADAGA